VFGDADDEAQVAADHAVARFHVAFGDAVGQLALFVDRQQLEFTDLREIKFYFCVVDSRKKTPWDALRCE